MKIEKLDNKGRGITYYNDKIMFVNNALPGEDVEVTNIKDNNKFYEADVLSYNETSINRVIPKCPYYNFCGGCNLMHMNIEYQEEYKENKLKELLKKYSNIDINVRFLKNDKELFYRNKLTLKIENGIWGFYNSSTHNIVEVNKCLLASTTINDILSQKELFDINNGEITIRSNYKKEILISIYTQDKYKIDFDNMPLNVVGIVVNNKTVYKENYFEDMIDDLVFKVSFDSFFQVNNYMAGRIFEILRNNISGKNLLDLYCGVGTLGLALKDSFKNIYGIEKVKNAAIDAKYNAVSNYIKNAHYYAGDTAKILKKINMKFDTVIVDPPRSGLNDATIKDIININPKTICYVSCDPMTLTRDLKILSDKYRVSKVYGLDMFPLTYHVESVVLLERK